MFGCYRKGEANDPETYVAAITATLARYPEDVIISVTHPASGLPVKQNFLPTVKEVFDACEELLGPRKRKAELDRAREKQFAELAEFDRLNPNYDEMMGLKKTQSPKPAF